jgi:hypothetical protein
MSPIIQLKTASNGAQNTSLCPGDEYCAVDPSGFLNTRKRDWIWNMHLLQCKTFGLESFDDPVTRPPYVILSHRWRDEEVLFGDIREEPYKSELELLRKEILSLRKELKFIAQDPQRRQASSNMCPAVSCSEEQTPKGDDNTRLRWARGGAGWAKLERCCAEASTLGYSYVWIDTCCI